MKSVSPATSLCSVNTINAILPRLHTKLEKKRSLTQVHMHGTLCHRLTFVTRLLPTAQSVNSRHSRSAEPLTVSGHVELIIILFYFFYLFIFPFSVTTVMRMRSSCSQRGRNDHWWRWWWSVSLNQCQNYSNFQPMQLFYKIKTVVTINIQIKKLRVRQYDNSCQPMRIQKGRRWGRPPPIGLRFF